MIATIDPCYRIIYSSHSLLDSIPGGAGPEIRRILGASRVWNTKVGITGALMLSHNFFAQVLEGPAGAVKSLYGFIACNPANTGNVLLFADVVPERSFAYWSMAFIDQVSDEQILLTSGGARGRDVLQPNDSEAILRLLRYIVTDVQDDTAA